MILKARVELPLVLLVVGWPMLGMVWAIVDVERAVLHMRTMLMSLAPYRRNSSATKKLPFKHQSLQIVADKLHASEDEAAPEREVDSSCSHAAGSAPSASTSSEVQIVQAQNVSKKIMITISDPPTPQPVPEIGIDVWSELEKTFSED